MKLTPDNVELVRNRFCRALHKSVSHQTEREQTCMAVDHTNRTIVGKNVTRPTIDAITSKLMWLTCAVCTYTERMVMINANETRKSILHLQTNQYEQQAQQIQSSHGERFFFFSFCARAFAAIVSIKSLHTNELNYKFNRNEQQKNLSREIAQMLNRITRKLLPRAAIFLSTCGDDDAMRSHVQIRI